MRGWVGLCLQALMALKKGGIPGWRAQRKGGHAGPCRKRWDEAEQVRGLMLGSSPRVRREARGFRDYQTVPKICVVLETARYPRRGGSLGKTLSKVSGLWASTHRVLGPRGYPFWLTTWAGPKVSEGQGWLFWLGSQAGLGPRVGHTGKGPCSVTHSAADTKPSSCPSFSPSTSRVRASPVDCSPMTTHCGGGCV